MDHLDAIISGGLVALASILVYARTLGRMEASLSELSNDVKEIKTGVAQVRKRFHWLNGFSMSLYASVRQLCEKAGVTPPYFAAYDYEHEKDGAVGQ